MTALGAVSTPPRRRTDPDLARAVARIFTAAGVPSSALRLRAASEPEFADLFLAVADAMDESRRRPHLRLLPGGAS